MSRTLTRLLAFLTIAVSGVFIDGSFIPTAREIDRHWLDWKMLHGRVYSNNEEEAYRKGVFARNLLYIKGQNRRYNAGLESYQTGLNQFADLTNTEFAELFLGTKPERRVTGKSRRMWQPPVPTGDIPDTVDWRDKNLVTEVKDQVSFTKSTYLPKAILGFY